MITISFFVTHFGSDREEPPYHRRPENTDPAPEWGAFLRAWIRHAAHEEDGGHEEQCHEKDESHEEQDESGEDAFNERQARPDPYRERCLRLGRQGSKGAGQSSTERRRSGNYGVTWSSLGTSDGT